MKFISHDVERTLPNTSVTDTNTSYVRVSDRLVDYAVGHCGVLVAAA